MEIELNADPSIRLTRALLIYEGGRGDGEVIVTQHEVASNVIQPGMPLDLPSFRKLIDKGESKKKSSEWNWQFPRMIAESRERIAWWSPPAVRNVFIGSGKKSKIKKAWIPALIWCASRTAPHCYLWAYNGASSPSQDTDVYRPQFGPNGGLNHVHADNAICIGSMRLPNYQPATWENSFWVSLFKEAGNLDTTEPYACQTRFKKNGTLSSVLPRCKAAD